MKHKGLCALATAAMLVLAAGCGSSTGEENPQNQVTEAVSPTEVPEATVTTEPTATPAPTATPVPTNYMEANGIEVLGAGWHSYTGYTYREQDEAGNPVLEMGEYACRFEVEEEDNGDGTKTIEATISVMPHIYEDGYWVHITMGGFVDLQSGKAFSPQNMDIEQATVLKQEEKNYELMLFCSSQKASSTNPYNTQRYILTCPSDYEDAGFYITSFDVTTNEAYIERMGLWKKLNYIRHGEAEMLVFGVNEGLNTMAKTAEKPLPEPEGSFYEENGIEIKGEGTHTWLGTEFVDRKNSETGVWELVSVETKEVETEFYVTEESLGDGTKIVKGTFVFVDEVSEDAASGIMCTCGIADKKTGLVYMPRTYFLAEPHVMEKDGEEISILVAVEQEVEVLDDGKEKVSMIYSIICPENYEDAVFFITGKYERTDRDSSEKREPYSLTELENGETDLVFFR